MESNFDKIITSVIPQHICDLINQKYYDKIPKAVNFEHLIHSQNFLKNPTDDIALFSDHALNHIKNVAGQVPSILQCVHGIHIPKRTQMMRLEFMRCYGIILGFIHDIGMSDVSLFGRAMHGEFVAQEVFMPSFAPIFELMWDENLGNIPWYLLNMHQEGTLSEEPKIVFRELLSLACCHRKQLVPVSLLNNWPDLRTKMQYFISNSLQFQYCKKQNLPIPKEAQSNDKLQKHLDRIYKNFHEQSFSWLINNDKASNWPIYDVIDTLRILRCADALRQRGTELKTSAQFQIFINQFTGNAIYALTSKKGHMYFLEVDKSINSGEANVANMYFTKEGELRFTLHRGFFHSEEATKHGLQCLQQVIIQLDNDIADTFNRNDIKLHKRLKLLIESTDDYPEFTIRLVKNILTLKPELSGFIEIVPSLKLAAQTEYNNYINAPSIKWNEKEKCTFLKKIAANGHKTDHIDLHKAFQYAKIIKIKADETLFEAKTPSVFVYFPFSHGLLGYPTGYYSPFQVAAWTPLGNTGVIRGDIRNATIIAKKNVKLLMVPKDDYLHYWYATYRTDEFVDAIKNGKIK